MYFIGDYFYIEMNNSNSPQKIIRAILTAIGLAVSCIVFSVLGGILFRQGLGDGSLVDLGLAILGLILGYIFGIAVGLCAIRYILKQKGSIILGIVAAIILAGLSITAVTLLKLNDNLVSIFTGAFLIFVPVAALLGFRFKR